MPWLSNDEFFEIMDRDAQIESHLAEVLCEFWPRFAEEVTAFGSLIDFRTAWTDAEQCPPGLWTKAANELINTEVTQFSLMTVKAFPLEYEGNAPSGSSFEYALRRRQQAMVRHYNRLLDVSPFPGPAGEEGWLYRINPGLTGAVEEPRLNSPGDGAEGDEGVALRRMRRVLAST